MTLITKNRANLILIRCKHTSGHIKLKYGTKICFTPSVPKKSCFDGTGPNSECLVARKVLFN